MAPRAHSLGVLLSAEILSAAVFSEPALAGTGATCAHALRFGTEAVAVTDPWINREAMAAIGAWLGLFWLMVIHQLTVNGPNRYPEHWGGRHAGVEDSTAALRPRSQIWPPSSRADNTWGACQAHQGAANAHRKDDLCFPLKTPNNSQQISGYFGPFESTPVRSLSSEAGVSLGAMENSTPLTSTN